MPSHALIRLCFVIGGTSLGPEVSLDGVGVLRVSKVIENSLA